MKRFRLRQRWGWAMTALPLMLVFGLVGVFPELAFTKSPASIWTERPVNAAAMTRQGESWVELARALKPAVVNVNTRRVDEGRGPSRGQDPFGQLFPQFPGERSRRTIRGVGSGFIINPDGHIITNNHVVADAKDVRVTLADGRELAAKVLGGDPKTDLALLKVEATGLPVIPLGNSSEVEVGEPVMAIGNPFGLEQTVTTGIVSATGRVIGGGPYDSFIQTDASINPGNSGGPLINTRGQAIGVTTAIFSQSGGSIGIGFAIPVDLAKPVVAQLAATGQVVRGWLGVAIQRVTPELAKGFNLPEAQGALVASVAENSPAKKAGLEPGDVIVAYDGRKVARSDELPRAVAETPVGREVSITVMRGGKTVTLKPRIAKLDEPGAPTVASATGQEKLGLSVQTLTTDLARELGVSGKTGVVVRGVEDGSPAADAGLQPGDVITEVDHRPVKSVEELKQVVDRHGAGAPLLFLIHRDDGTLYIAVPA